MKISVEVQSYSHETNSPILEMRAEQDAADKAKDIEQRAKFNHGRVIFQLENADVYYQTHPDLIALACLLTYRPFISRELTLNFPVSAEFAWLVDKYQKITISPVSPHITRRNTDDSYGNALSFSGGVDSCVALELMPENTTPVFLRRLRPEGEPMGLYRDGGAMASCEAVTKLRTKAYAYLTSMEYARNPVGFPVDWSNCTPIVLHSDFFKFRSVAFGMIMESAFSLGKDKYKELSDKSIYSQWSPLFEYVGLSICLPTCGLSEVVTSHIALNNLSSWKPSSCVRVIGDEPCVNCFKCFRKKIIDSGALGQSIPFGYLDIPYRQKSAADHICLQPMHHEAVTAYSLAKTPYASHDLYIGLMKKTQPLRDYGGGLSFLERYYPPALEYIPDIIRGQVKLLIEKYVHPMSDEEVSLVRNWDISNITSQKNYIEGQQQIIKSLGRSN